MNKLTCNFQLADADVSVDVCSSVCSVCSVCSSVCRVCRVYIFIEPLQLCL